MYINIHIYKWKLLDILNFIYIFMYMYGRIKGYNKIAEWQIAQGNLTREQVENSSMRQYDNRIAKLIIIWFLHIFITSSDSTLCTLFK
jgi:hypothetical protein